jgi:phage terminase large subunit-like protein
MSLPNKTINQVLLDMALLGAVLGNPETWIVWLVVFQAAFGLLLDETQQKIFSEVSGGRAPPTKRVRELWAVVGRRGGKSRMAAALAWLQAREICD